jgi:hypothetical protein
METSASFEARSAPSSYPTANQSPSLEILDSNYSCLPAAIIGPE